MALVELTESWNQTYTENNKIQIERVWIAEWSDVYYGNPDMPYPGAPVDVNGLFPGVYCTDVRITPYEANNNTHAKVMATYNSKELYNANGWKFTIGTTETTIPGSNYNLNVNTSTLESWYDNYLSARSPSSNDAVPEPPDMRGCAMTLTLTAFGGTSDIFAIKSDYLLHVNSDRFMDYLSGVVRVAKRKTYADGTPMRMYTYNGITRTYPNGGEPGEGITTIQCMFDTVGGLNDVGWWLMTGLHITTIADGYFQFDFSFEAYNDNEGYTKWNEPQGTSYTRYKSANFSNMLYGLDNYNIYTDSSRGS